MGKLDSDIAMKYSPSEWVDYYHMQLNWVSCRLDDMLSINTPPTEGQLIAIQKKLAEVLGMMETYSPHLKSAREYRTSKKKERANNVNT